MMIVSPCGYTRMMRHRHHDYHPRPHLVAHVPLLVQEEPQAARHARGYVAPNAAQHHLRVRACVCTRAFRRVYARSQLSRARARARPTPCHASSHSHMRVRNKDSALEYTWVLNTSTIWGSTHHRAARHVLAAVVARALHHRLRHGVAHGKALARAAVYKQAAARGAVQARVADQAGAGGLGRKAESRRGEKARRGVGSGRGTGGGQGERRCHDCARAAARMRAMCAGRTSNAALGGGTMLMVPPLMLLPT